MQVKPVEGVEVTFSFFCKSTRLIRCLCALLLGTVLQIENVRALTEQDRDAARQRQQKQQHMIKVIWEIGLYFIFLWLVVVIAYTDRDERAFLMTKASEETFDVKGSFSDINTFVRVIESQCS